MATLGMGPGPVINPQDLPPQGPVINPQVLPHEEPGPSQITPLIPKPPPNEKKPQPATTPPSTAGKAAKSSCLVAGAAFSIFFIVIGGIYDDDCPGSPSLGPVLVVFGSLALIACILECLPSKHHETETENGGSILGRILNVLVLRVLIILTQFVLFIYLCVVVYSLYPDVNYDDPSNEFYCSETLFLTVFITITIELVIIGILICVFCALCWNLKHFTK